MEQKEKNIVYALITIISVLATTVGNLTYDTINPPREKPYTSDDGNRDRTLRREADDREAQARREADSRLWAKIDKLEERLEACRDEHFKQRSLSYEQ